MATAWLSESPAHRDECCPGLQDCDVLAQVEGRSERLGPQPTAHHPACLWKALSLSPPLAQRLRWQHCAWICEHIKRLDRALPCLLYTSPSPRD
eukprot:13182245-Alexandrium_andersonii.AAC.1